MRVRRLAMAFAWSVLAARAFAQTTPLTLQQILSAPYASELTAAPVGGLFAWVEDVEGRHNLWVGGPHQPARMLTHNTADDGQDIRQLAWSPDGKAIAYTYGTASGADGKPADPAHVSAMPLTVIVQPIAPEDKPVVIGPGHNPIFQRGSCGVLYVQAGKVWSRGFKDEPHPGSQVGIGDPDYGSTNSVLDPIECDRSGGPQQLVFDRGSASSLWLSPDGNTLAFISRRTEANAPAHSLLALYDLRAMVLTFPAPSTGNDLAPAFSPNGQQIAWLRAPFTPVREFALDRVSANPWAIEVMDLQTHAVRTVFAPEANKPGSAVPKMSTGEPYLLWAPGNRIIFFSEKSGYLHPYIVAAEGGEARDLLAGAEHPRFEVEDATLSRDGKSLLYSAAGALWNCVADACDRKFPLRDAVDMRTVWKIQIDLGKQIGRPTPLTRSGMIATHPEQLEDGTLGALVAGAHKPMRPVMLANKTVSTMDEVASPMALREVSAASALLEARLVKPAQAIFNSTGTESQMSFSEEPLTVDVNHLHGQLFLPKQEADPSAALQDDKSGGRKTAAQPSVVKHPAILFFHGGPRRQMLLGYPPGEYYSNAYAMNQYLASRGFIVLSVNYRCGSGYGLEFRQCEHAGADGASEYADVLAAQRYLASRPDVDAKRIGVWGGSYGGYLTALALARNSDLFAAGVDFHGVHDWNLEDNASDWKQGTFAEQDAIAAKAFASSPMADVARWCSPVLLIHGDNDAEVAYAETAFLADRLRAQHVPVEELIFLDETHNFLLHSDWLKAYEAAAAFFERTLKP